MVHLLRMIDSKSSFYIVFTVAASLLSLLRRILDAGHMGGIYRYAGNLTDTSGGAA